MDIYYSEKHQLHDTGNLIIEGKPFDTLELPQRAEFLFAAVSSAQLGDIHPPQDHGLTPVLAVHDTNYIDFLQTIYERYAELYKQPYPVFPATYTGQNIRRKSSHPEGLLGYYSFGTGSPILAGTWQAAYWSAQVALSGADALLSGDRSAYALCRPPGHHAAAALYGGFCYLNNAAIAARYLHTKATAEPYNVAILDTDYHHGNGTQEIFYNDPGVLYCSIHVDPDQDYPYFWGGADETGEGSAVGANRNWPLPVGSGDEQYLAALDEALDIIASFEPRYLVISAGWDIRSGDPAGGFKITQDGFAEIASRIASLNLQTLVVQEGGYLLDEIGACAVTFLEALT